MDTDLVSFDKKLTSDFRVFCRQAPMVIKDKEGHLGPLVLNRAQRYIEEQIEKMRREVGFVRVLILKGRQQGSSTYVGGRFMWKAVRKPGTNVYILAHDSDTTNKLFNMAKLYHEMMRTELRPEIAYSNRKELLFSKLKSEYCVGTAGNKEGGRGGTTRLFHGSEVAFWVNTQEIKKGALQTVPLSKDTEIILESTANGMGNMFYDMCGTAMDATSNKRDKQGNPVESLYRLIFVPWYWQEEYQLEPPPHFKHTEEELELRDTYGTLPAQLYWRRMKIIEFKSEGKSGVFSFKQEYPFNAPEAFQTSGDALISSEDIYRARKSNYVDSTAPIIFGVDPSGTGKDRAVLVIRQGRQILHYEVWDQIRPMDLVGKIGQYAIKYKPLRIFIDYSHGYAVADRLKELKHKGVQHIHFQGEADDDEIYANKRAEMWLRMQEWFKSEANMPDDDSFQSDLQCMPEVGASSNSRIKLASKIEIKKVYKKSPDIGDAAALTFARNVRRVSSSAGANGGQIRRKSGLKSRRH